MRRSGEDDNSDIRFVAQWLLGLLDDRCTDNTSNLLIDRTVVAAIARTVGQVLIRHGTLDRNSWVDDIMVWQCLIENERNCVIIRGLLITGKRRQSDEWVDPLQIRLCIDSHKRCLNVSVSIGDVSLGLQTVRYANRRRIGFGDIEWLLTAEEAHNLANS